MPMLPVLTSTGRGSDIMVPMTVLRFGGMRTEIIAKLVVPVLYCMFMEWKLKRAVHDDRLAEP
jgi:Cu(I)/Ag(I) efflux system membrane protein CusA/SilA